MTLTPEQIKEARIRLAEAMGWTDLEDHSDYPDITSLHGTSPTGRRHRKWPDPFTDANDDYAVLEWMRKTCPGGCFDDGYGDERPRWVAYLGHIMEGDDREDCLDYGAYQIGDYARAALKVISDDK